MVGLTALRLASFRNYLPVVLALMMTWLFSNILIMSRIRPEKPVLTPVEEPEPTAPPAEALTNPAPYINTLIFIAVIAVSGVVLLFLARRVPRLFKALVATLIWLVSLSITLLYLISSTLIWRTPILYLWLPLSVTAATAVTYALMRGRELGAAFSAAYIASGAGGVLGISMPYWTFLVLVAGISAYDVFAVFKGHLSSLTKKDAPSIRGLAIEVGDVALGLGDLFFYSLTLSAILWNYGSIPALAATISLLAGYTLVLASLHKRKILPGLPIPLILALASALVARNILM